MNKSMIDDKGEVLELDDAFFKRARRGRPAMLEEERKSRVTMFLDKDIIEHFKKGGKGWQTRLNDKLRETLEM